MRAVGVFKGRQTSNTRNNQTILLMASMLVNAELLSSQTLESQTSVLESTTIGTVRAHKQKAT